MVKGTFFIHWNEAKNHSSVYIFQIIWWISKIGYSQLNSNKAILLVFGDEACIDNGLSDSSINVFDKTVQQYCLKID